MTGVVTLKNGAEVHSAVVGTTMLALRMCLKSKPFAFYDLVCICRRDESYVSFGDNEQYLRSLALLEPSGQPHEVVRDVVLSAVTGDGTDMALGSPLPEVTA